MRFFHEGKTLGIDLDVDISEKGVLRCNDCDFALVEELGAVHLSDVGQDARHQGLTFEFKAIAALGNVDALTIEWLITECIQERLCQLGK